MDRSLLSITFYLAENRNYFVCPGCDYEIPLPRMEINANLSVKTEAEVQHVDDKDSRNVVAHNCDKCHHDKALFWQMQTRSGDEGATLFYECVSCGHSMREVSGVNCDNCSYKHARVVDIWRGTNRTQPLTAPFAISPALLLLFLNLHFTSYIVYLSNDDIAIKVVKSKQK